MQAIALCQVHKNGAAHAKTCMGGPLFTLSAAKGRLTQNARFFAALRMTYIMCHASAEGEASRLPRRRLFAPQSSAQSERPIVISV